MKGSIYSRSHRMPHLVRSSRKRSIVKTRTEREESIKYAHVHRKSRAALRRLTICIFIPCPSISAASSVNPTFARRANQHQQKSEGGGNVQTVTSQKREGTVNSPHRKDDMLMFMPVVQRPYKPFLKKRSSCNTAQEFTIRSIALNTRPMDRPIATQQKDGDLNGTGCPGRAVASFTLINACAANLSMNT